ncbi:uncharacterized protein LOC131656520 [Vicia villosa]|uniref:uncharacterized protein LOC131656520 n=1 Tax=Vicia villosa TaxID=3911 RepID=UPI00273CC628|nr:uncharacterized protein LOC131656520 [Vicia villosa]
MTTSEKFVQPSIPKFDGHYDYWSMMMENFLRSKEMLNLVDEGILAAAIGSASASEAQRKTVEEAKLKDLKVKNFLFQAIDKEVIETILDKGTSKAIWDSMKRKISRVYKGEKGTTAGIKKGVRVAGHERRREKESNYLSTLSIDELHGSLLVHKQRMQGYQEEEHVLKVAHDDRSNRGRGRGMFRGGCGRGRGRQPMNKAVIECFKCHKLGHFQYECLDWEKKANYAELEEEELLLMAYADIHQEKKEEIWFLDSGCSNHMTGNKEWFFELEENFN